MARSLYVVCEDDDSVLAVDVRTQQVVKKAKVGHKPKDLAVSPDGKTLYVSNEWSDTVSVVDTTTFQVRKTLATGWGPRGLTTDRAGKILYVANSIGNDVSVLDLATGHGTQAADGSALATLCATFTRWPARVRLESPAAPWVAG